MPKVIFAFLLSLCLYVNANLQVSDGRYLLLRGSFVIIGKQPDGDSIRFIPNSPALFKQLKRSSRIRPSTDGSVQLRFEGIDAPQLHFENLIQPLSREPCDALLERLGFASLVFTPQGLEVRSSVPFSVRGAILSEAAEGNGRPISYVFLERDLSGADGARLNPDTVMLRRSLNAFLLESGNAYLLESGNAYLLESGNAYLLESGNAYLTVYSSQPEADRTYFRGLALTARNARRGVWALDRTANFDLSNLESVTTQQLILPKLFRRTLVYFQDVARGFKGSFGDWFAANPSRDDGVMIGSRRTTLSKVLEVRGSRVRLLVDQLDLVLLEQ